MGPFTDALAKWDASNRCWDVTLALLFFTLLFYEGCHLKDVALSKTSVGAVGKNKIDKHRSDPQCFLESEFKGE